MWTRALLVACALSACGGGGGTPLRPRADADGPALDTAARSEPDRSWDGGLTARNITWSYNFATPLRTSISVVGSFRFTLVNADRQRGQAAGLLLRFVAPDGTRHVAETPVTRVTVAADSLVSVRENFVLEVTDTAAANAIEHMDLSLF